MNIISDKRESLEERAAYIISEKIDNVLKIKDFVVLGLPGGTSVSGIFMRLSEKNIDWNKVHLFVVDERIVDIDHEDSNFRLIKQGINEVRKLD